MDQILRGKEPSEVIPFGWEDPVLYYPVRHHSPACAWHLQRVIQRYRPDCILIEGPEDAGPLLPLLAPLLLLRLRFPIPAPAASPWMTTATTSCPSKSNPSYTNGSPIGEPFLFAQICRVAPKKGHIEPVQNII